MEEVYIVMVTVISSLVIATGCMIGVITNKYEDTLFQRCVLAALWFISLARCCAGYRQDDAPFLDETFTMLVALWSISLFWKYRK